MNVVVMTTQPLVAVTWICAPPAVVPVSWILTSPTAGLVTEMLLTSSGLAVYDRVEPVTPPEPARAVRENVAAATRATKRRSAFFVNRERATVTPFVRRDPCLAQRPTTRKHPYRL